MVGSGQRVEHEDAYEDVAELLVDLVALAKYGFALLHEHWVDCP